MTAKRSAFVYAVLAAFSVGGFPFVQSAKADTYKTYSVNATYDTTGSVIGTFTLDTTDNTSAAVDLAIIGAGGVNTGAYTDPTQFQTGTYNTAAGEMDTYNAENPALQVYLTYPVGGGSLYNGGFGSSSVDSFFSPSCGAIVAATILAAPLRQAGPYRQRPSPQPGP